MDHALQHRIRCMITLLGFAILVCISLIQSSFGSPLFSATMWGRHVHLKKITIENGNLHAIVEWRDFPVDALRSANYLPVTIKSVSSGTISYDGPLEWNRGKAAFTATFYPKNQSENDLALLRTVREQVNAGCVVIEPAALVLSYGSRSLTSGINSGTYDIIHSKGSFQIETAAGSVVTEINKDGEAIVVHAIAKEIAGDGTLRFAGNDYSFRGIAKVTTSAY